MFAVGQRVWHRTAQRSGTVIECDGDRVFIAQENGAELDFAASELTATPPEAAKVRQTDSRGMPQPGAAPALNRALTPSEITPEHLRVLGVVPVRTVRAVAVVFELTSKGARFSALDPAAKLNAIAAITGVPYRTMRVYSDRPGELGLLMGKGLADRG